MKWFIENWLAIFALLVAIVGGVPGVLKIVQHFRPIFLSGSIKFFATTKSPDPPEDGILLAVTLLNEGTKNLVWRKLAGTLELVGKKIALTPKLIPVTLLLDGHESPQPDLMNQQSILPGIPVNAYLLLTATSGYLTVGVTPTKLSLQFELESGRNVGLELPFDAVHPVQQGESFPSHSIKFR